MSPKAHLVYPQPSRDNGSAHTVDIQDFAATGVPENDAHIAPCDAEMLGNEIY
jgi:hypothetical protein